MNIPAYSVHSRTELEKGYSSCRTTKQFVVSRQFQEILCHQELLMNLRHAAHLSAGSLDSVDHQKKKYRQNVLKLEFLGPSVDVVRKWVYSSLARTSGRWGGVEWAVNSLRGDFTFLHSFCRPHFSYPFVGMSRLVRGVYIELLDVICQLRLSGSVVTLFLLSKFQHSFSRWRE